MASGKVNFPGRVQVGSKIGAAQPATVIKSKATTRKSKWPSKAGRYGSTILIMGRPEKRAT